MRSIIFVFALVALLVACKGAPLEDGVIQHIPQKQSPTPLATHVAGSGSGAAANAAGASKVTAAETRVRRDIAGQESDLLPSINDVDAAPFGELSQVAGPRGRIRVLPAFIG